MEKLPKKTTPFNNFDYVWMWNVLVNSGFFKEEGKWCYELLVFNNIEEAYEYCLLMEDDNDTEV